MIARARRLAPLLAAWLAISCVYAAPLLLGQQRLRTGDLTGQFHAVVRYQARELRAGRLPVWSEGSYAGVPLVGDIQSAWWYPLRWPTIVAAMAWPDTTYALELEALLHLWMAGVGMILLVRHIAADDGLPGLLAAIAFGLGGYLTGYPILQLAVLETVAWAPWILWALRRATSASARGQWALAAGLFSALAVTAGHPQTLLHVAYLCAAYYVYRIAAGRWSLARAISTGAIVALVAVGASCATWLPALTYMRETTRSAVDYRFVSSGMAILDYVQALLPGTRSLWSPPYVGVGALLLALAGMSAHEGDGARRGERRFWVGVALVAGLLSLGDKGILYELAYRALPGMGLFRQQERWCGLVNLALAVLAGLGAERWRYAPRRAWLDALRPALGWVAGGLLLAVLTLTLVAAGDTAATHQTLTVGAIAAALLVASAALLWVPTLQKRALLVATLLILVLCADLARLAPLHREPGSPWAVWPQARWLPQAVTSAPTRLDAEGFAYANLGEAYGVETVSGISPLRPANLDALRELPPQRQWALLNVGHVLTADGWARQSPSQALEPVLDVPEGAIPGQHGAATLYRVVEPGPRAWLCREARAVADDEALRLLADPAFDVRATALVHGAAPSLPWIVDKDAAAGENRVQVTGRTPGRLDLDVVASTPSWLVVSERHAPGWRATVDGARVPLARADIALMAMPVSPGRHSVSLRHRPWEVPVGLGVSLTTLVASIVALARRPALTELAQAETHARPLLRPREAPPHTARAPQRPHQAWSVHHAWPWALTIVALGLRILLLGQQELDLDEASAYLLARLPLVEALRASWAEGRALSPLGYVTLRLSTRLLGDAEWALRLPSALAGTLLVPAMWYMGRRIYDERLGLSLAVAAALSSALVRLGQNARSGSALALLLATLATVALIRAAERSSPWRWASYTLACALAACSSPYGLVILAPHLAYILALPHRPRALTRWFLAAAIAVAMVAVPWMLAAGASLGPSAGQSSASEPRLATIAGECLAWVTAGGGWRRRAERYLAFSAACLAALGAIELGRGNVGRVHGAARPLCLTWVGATLWTLFVAQLRGGAPDLRSAAILAPAWWALLTMGILRIARLPWGRPAGVLAAALLVLASFASLTGYFLDPEQSRTAGYRDVAQAVAMRALPGDALILEAADPRWAYYARHSDLPRHALASRLVDPPEVDALVGGELEELGRAYDRLWCVPKRPDHAAGESPALTWLDSHALREGAWSFERLTLYAYRPARTALDAMTPLDAVLDGALALRAWHAVVDGQPLPGDAAPLRVSPGADLAVTLAWETSAHFDGERTVFLHLVDRSGALVGQHDGVPVDGSRPTHTWTPGELILDRHELAIPEEYVGGQLLAGLYDPATMIRSRDAGGRDAIALARVETR